MTQDTRDMLERSIDNYEGRDEAPRKKGRETKQERKIRLASERQIELDRLRNTWHERLFDLLARCSAVGMSIYARKENAAEPAEIRVFENDRNDYYSFSAVWGGANETYLLNCECDVECREREQAEKARQQELAKQARLKLTAEELEALKKEIEK